MCISNLQRRYIAWVDRHELHPIWLNLKDVKIQEKYMNQQRCHVYGIIKTFCAIAVTFTIISLIKNYDESFDDQVASLMLTLPTSCCLLILSLAIKCKLALADYSVISLLAVRCSYTLLIVHFQQRISGFEELDIKELSEYLILAAQCLYATLICNLKLDLLVTAPMILASIVLVNQRESTVRDDEESCIDQKSTSPGQIMIRQSFQLVLMLVIGYVYQRRTLQRLLEQEKSNKQQEYLQSLFDNQPDGVIILTQQTASLKPPDKTASTKPPDNKPLEQEDSESYFQSSYASASHLDSGFPSFVNPTETAGQEESSLKMVFHNEALLKILGVHDTKDLHAVLGKQQFISRKLGNPLSLFETAQSRFSDSILGQTYNYVRKTLPNPEGETKVERVPFSERTRLISF